MIYNIPLPSSESSFEQQVALDGTTYTLRLLWNARVARYFMSLEEQDGTPIVTGRKVVADIPWAVHDAIGTMPAGQLWVSVTDPPGVDPGLRDLGVRAFVGYVS